jgi:hypothetical protein
MVIVKLKGGLGNQLFQYAAGLALSINNGAELKIDISKYQNMAFEDEMPRHLGVDDFLITASVATNDEITSLKYPYRFISKLGRMIDQKILRRYYVDWHPEVLSKLGNVYLEGYFQTEKYFLSQIDSIIKEFTLKPELYKEIQEIIQLIECQPSSASIHIRRGDYVEDAKTSEYHLICDIDYYQRAIAELKKRVSNLHLFVFSDDVRWVKEHLGLTSKVTFISSEDVCCGRFKPSQELVLMSKCQHHIISNSSFSWWGAYLNRFPKKIVLAPNVWSRKTIAQPNILPDRWVPLSVELDR